MQELLERIKKAVTGYTPQNPEQRMRSIRSLHQALKESQAYIEEHSKTDTGISQRLVREIDHICVAMPELKHQIGDEKLIASRHTQRLANQHLEELQATLATLVAEEDAGKKKAKVDWVRSHPVFGELKKSLRKHSGNKDEFIFLFERTDEASAPRLFLRKKPDETVLTRFRRRDLADDLHIYNLFHNKTPIVGAVITAHDKVVANIGTLPAVPEGKDIFSVVRGLSRDEASKPAQAYVESNPVLAKLNAMARAHQIPKEAYVLLFSFGVEPAAEPGSEPVANEAEEQPESAASPEPSEAARVEATATELQLVEKSADEEKVITRFWSPDFVAPFKIYEFFKSRPDVVGAAIVKKNELVETIGTVPEASDGKAQLDAILAPSHEAIRKPSLDYLEQNEVLKRLYELNGENKMPRDAYALLFVQTDGAFKMWEGERHQPRVPLSDFQSPGAIRQRFATQPKIIGASVITGDTTFRAPGDNSREHRGRHSGDQRGRDSGDQRGRDSGDQRGRRHGAAAVVSKPSVVAAFGRTPLKQSLLATPENLKRLGIEF